MTGSKFSTTMLACTSNKSYLIITLANVLYQNFHKSLRQLNFCHSRSNFAFKSVQLLWMADKIISNQSIVCISTSKLTTQNSYWLKTISTPPSPPTSVTITFMTSKNFAYILSNFIFFTSSNNEKSFKKLTYV